MSISRSGKTAIQIEMEVREREARALELRRLNWSYPKIADEIGWSNEATARAAVSRALARHEDEDVEALRLVENAKIDALEARCLAILDKTWVRIDHGKVMQELMEFPVLDADGNPQVDEHGEVLVEHRMVSVEDPGPHLAAVREMRQLLARRAQLRGLDAPLRKIVEVITDDVVEAEIRRLEALAENLSRTLADEAQ